MTYTTITECRACGSTSLLPYLNLTPQPLANSFHPPEETLPVFPLELMLCRHCFHSQLSVVVDPDVLYRHYLYVTGTSNTIREYCEVFANMVTHIMKSSGADLTDPYILDIASNDGTQLNAFKSRGWNTWGVDPAKNLAGTAQLQGHNIVSEFWNDRALSFIPRFIKFNVITAQNVFAHTHDVNAFLMTCQPVMTEKSLLFIQTSQADMFLRNEFDTAYHEHLSFFNTLSMHSTVARAGMVLENVFKTSVHGNSYVFVISLNGNVMSTSNVEDALAAERTLGLYDERTYHDFAAAARRCVTEFADYVRTKRAEGKKVIGYGAAAKGMTVLNFGNIQLDYIVDDNPLKQGLLTPGQNIPVVPSSQLFNEPDDVIIVPLAWNFFDEILGRIRTHRFAKADTFVRYFPTLVTK